MSRLGLFGVALLSMTGYAASCSRSQATDSPPVPSVITPTAEPVPDVAQDPSVCPAACQAAQTACRTHTPKPVAYCVGKCVDSVHIAAPSLTSLAVVYTCDEDAP